MYVYTQRVAHLDDALRLLAPLLIHISLSLEAVQGIDLKLILDLILPHTHIKPVTIHYMRRCPPGPSKILIHCTVCQATGF